MVYIPRGIRICNPGNIRKSEVKWQGEVDGSDPDFCTFDTPQHGLRAIMVLFRRYNYVLELNTISKVIARWAPDTENNTTAYITAVAKQMGMDKNAPLKADGPTSILFAQAITVHENGRSFLPYPPLWYAPTVYAEAYALTLPHAV